VEFGVWGFGFGFRVCGLGLFDGSVEPGFEEYPRKRAGKGDAGLLSSDYGLGIRDEGLGFRVQGLGFTTFSRLESLMFWV